MSIQASVREEVQAPGGPIPAAANRLLASLPGDDYLRIAPYLRRVALRSRQTLLRQGQPVQEIIFPSTGVCSLVKTTQAGHSIEVLGIGLEGAVGATVALGQPDSPTDIVVQLSDEAALSLPVHVLKEELERRGPLSAVMAHYCRVFMLQLMQASACHAVHSVEQRSCRWLLSTHARLQKDSFAMTQEMLSMALGVRRPTVTVIITALRRAGIVHYGRGCVKILNHAALVERACKCARV